MSEKPEHDGNLSSDGGRVSYDWLMKQGIRVEGRFYDGYNGVIVLYPGEALSLLVWLEQERETLEQMAKEQEA